MSIRARLLLLTLGLVIPLMMVGLYNQWDTWNASRSMLDSSIEQQAKLAATAFEQWVNAQRQTLLTISDLSSTGSANNSVLREYLNSIMKTRPAWLNIEIVSPDGEVVLAQSTKKWNLQATPLDKLKAEVDQKKSLVIITEQMTDKQLRLISMAMPLPDGNIVAARIDGTSASDVFNQLQLPADHTIAVFDANNQLIYRSQISPEQLSLDVSQTPLLNALSGKGTGVIEVESPYDKISRVYGLARVEPVNAIVAVGVPRSELYVTAEQLFNQQLLLSILISCLAVFAAFFIARTVVEPLRRLTAAARAFGEGDLTVRGGVEDNPAVRELGITFNRMAEKIAAREKKLKELDQLKSDFVSSVSHELRTPLTTIKTLTRVLQRSDLTPHDQAEYLETIGNECDRQIELVQNLLDLSRIESGTYKPSIEETHTSEILRSAVAVQHKAAEMRNHRLELFLPEEELPPIQADPAAFRRVVAGLLENAVKYTPHHGLIKVIAGRDGDQVVIEVSDTGCGIAEEDLNRIFEKFYRGRPLGVPLVGNGNGSSTEECLVVEKVPGVGLGLYLVKTLVDQMGGKIEVKSPTVDGRGTTFAVSLPVYNQATSAVEV
ncbi:MAG TPA: ATP-binding protein [Pyrinomonadaceae bacterium]